MTNDNVKRKVRDFFSSLTEEKETFKLPLSALLEYKFLVMKEKKGKIIGIAGIRKRNVCFVVVKSESQGKKIGQELLERVVQQAIKANYSYVSLNVLQSNTKAVGMFRKLGFKTLYSFLMDGQKTYFMILPLNGQGVICRNLFLLRHKLRLFMPTGSIFHEISGAGFSFLSR